MACFSKDCHWVKEHGDCFYEGLPMDKKENCPMYKAKTNADRIRSMSDEELATALYLLRLDALRLEGFEGFIETKDEVLEWLREEAESEGEDGNI